MSAFDQEIDTGRVSRTVDISGQKARENYPRESSAISFRKILSVVPGMISTVAEFASPKLSTMGTVLDLARFWLWDGRVAYVVERIQDGQSQLVVCDQDQLIAGEEIVAQLRVIGHHLDFVTRSPHGQTRIKGGRLVGALVNDASNRIKIASHRI